MKKYDIIATIRLLFQVEHALREKQHMLNQEEQGLWHALGVRLEALRERIALSHPEASLADIRETIHTLDADSEEIQCWAEDSLDVIERTLVWRKRQDAPISKQRDDLSTEPPSSDVRTDPLFSPALSEEDASRQASLLKALASPIRLRILSLLNRYEGKVCVLEIVRVFPLEQPTISHHLRVLRQAGFLDCQKQESWAYYYVKRENLERIRKALEALFC
jgi:ArsR family transcriptional regulator, arsenate/arsenite/antimonite-responsive transcriptional repressor